MVWFENSQVFELVPISFVHNAYLGASFGFVVAYWVSHPLCSCCRTHKSVNNVGPHFKFAHLI